MVRGGAFVGRAVELDRLAGALREALDGRGSVALVTGEAGLGKSRLLEELAKRADGLTVHWGRAWEAGGAPAYWPWIQVLREIWSNEPDAFDASDPRLPWLTGLLPEIAVAISRTPPILAPDQARFAQLDAAVTVLARAATQTPRLILIEDLHAADTSSVLLLEMLARHVPQTRILAVGTFRPSDATRSEAGPILARLRRSAAHFPLGPLGDDDARTLLRDRFGDDAHPDTVDAVCASCMGHPLFLEEMAHAVPGGEIPPVLPDGIRAVIRQRVATVPASTQRILEAAAVIGHELELSDLASLTARNVEEVLPDLAAAVQAALLVPIGIGSDTPGSHRFAHILIRDVLHDEMEAEQRWALHRKRAERLENAGGEPPWPEIAEHWAEAGPEAWSTAVDAFDRAAEQALARHAFADAARTWERALATLRNADDTRRAHLLLGAGRTRLLAGDPEAGRAHCRAVADLARACGDAELLARAALTAGDVFMVARVDASLVGLLAEAERALGPSDHPLAARVRARLAAARQPAPNPDEPIADARAAIAMARRLGDPTTLLDTLRSAIGTMMDIGDPKERRHLNDEYVKLATELDEPGEVLRGLLRGSLDALELGNARAYREGVRTARTIEPRIAQPFYQWRIRGFESMLATFDGSFEAADALTAEAEKLAKRSGEPHADRALLLQRLGRHWARGQDDHAVEAAEKLRAQWPREGFLAAFADLLLAAARVRVKDPSVTVEPSRWRLAARLKDPSVVGPALEVAVALEHPCAPDLYRQLEPRAGGFVSWGMLGMHVGGAIDAYLALALEAEGRLDEAAKRYEAAIDLALGAGAFPIARRAQEALVGILRAQGDPRAADVAADSQATARHLGLDSAAEPAIPSTSTRTPPVRIEVHGDLTTVFRAAETVQLRTSKGLRILAQLVAEPERARHVLELDAPAAAGQVIDAGDAGTVLDDAAKADYRLRLEDLETELAEAESFADQGRIERLRAEQEALIQQLASAVGLGGRDRRVGKAAERARVNVQRRLRDAIKKIEAQSPELGRHFERSVRTGTLCRYEP